MNNTDFDFDSIATDGPTEGQMRFIADLRTGWEDAAREACELRGTPFTPPAWVDPATRAEASRMIEAGKAARRTARSVLADLRGSATPERTALWAPITSRTEVARLTEGLYVAEAAGSAWKVQAAVHGTGRLYAKRLDTETGKFEYTPGGITVLLRSNPRPMTKAEAASHGALYGRCMVCGRTLTDEDSIEAGIGPVCAEKF